MVIVYCKKCKDQTSVSDTKAGQTVNCGNCGAQGIVPVPDLMGIWGASIALQVFGWLALVAGGWFVYVGVTENASKEWPITPMALSFAVSSIVGGLLLIGLSCLLHCVRTTTICTIRMNITAAQNKNGENIPA